MVAAPLPPDESNRLAQLRALTILDTDAEERFDRITRLAQRLFGVPIALVSLVDEDRQWFKSVIGLDVPETPREQSFCAHAILGSEVLYVPDATVDPRFADNPLVVFDPGIRFYAGYPIAGPDGGKLGTLCVIDRVPRDLSASDTESLRDLAEMVEREIAAVQLATGDALTGLTNRRGFDLLGSKILEICTRRGLPATLLYLDLDGLKVINDRLGHDAGDEALREFARLLVLAFRGSDLIARLGGDEFAVLAVAAADAGRSLALLREALAERNSAADAPFALAASVGSANFDPARPEALEDLSKRADTAMYAEKRQNAALRELHR